MNQTTILSLEQNEPCFVAVLIVQRIKNGEKKYLKIILRTMTLSMRNLFALLSGDWMTLLSRYSFTCLSWNIVTMLSWHRNTFFPCNLSWHLGREIVTGFPRIERMTLNNTRMGTSMNHRPKHTRTQGWPLCNMSWCFLPYDWSDAIHSFVENQYWSRYIMI